MPEPIMGYVKPDFPELKMLTQGLDEMGQELQDFTLQPVETDEQVQVRLQHDEMVKQAGSEEKLAAIQNFQALEAKVKTVDPGVVQSLTTKFDTDEFNQLPDEHKVAGALQLARQITPSSGFGSVIKNYATGEERSVGSKESERLAEVARNHPEFFQPSDLKLIESVQSHPFLSGVAGGYTVGKSVASAASFGLSDAALDQVKQRIPWAGEKLTEFEKSVQEINERNPKLTWVGESVGTLLGLGVGGGVASTVEKAVVKRLESTAIGQVLSKTSAKEWAKIYEAASPGAKPWVERAARSYEAVKQAGLTGTTWATLSFPGRVYFQGYEEALKMYPEDVLLFSALSGGSSIPKAFMQGFKFAERPIGRIFNESKAGKALLAEQEHLKLTGVWDDVKVQTSIAELYKGKANLGEIDQVAQRIKQGVVNSFNPTTHPDQIMKAYGGASWVKLSGDSLSLKMPDGTNTIISYVPDVVEATKAYNENLGRMTPEQSIQAAENAGGRATGSIIQIRDPLVKESLNADAIVFMAKGEMGVRQAGPLKIEEWRGRSGFRTAAHEGLHFFFERYMLEEKRSEVLKLFGFDGSNRTQVEEKAATLYAKELSEIELGQRREFSNPVFQEMRDYYGKLNDVLFDEPMRTEAMKNLQGVKFELPDWVRETMIVQGKNSSRLLNEIDASRPETAKQLANDPLTKYYESIGDTKMAERMRRGDLSKDEYWTGFKKMQLDIRVSFETPPKYDELPKGITIPKELHVLDPNEFWMRKGYGFYFPNIGVITHNYIRDYTPEAHYLVASEIIKRMPEVREVLKVNGFTEKELTILADSPNEMAPSDALKKYLGAIRVTFDDTDRAIGVDVPLGRFEEAKRIVRKSGAFKVWADVRIDTEKDGVFTGQAEDFVQRPSLEEGKNQARFESDPSITEAELNRTSEPFFHQRLEDKNREILYLDPTTLFNGLMKQGRLEGKDFTEAVQAIQGKLLEGQLLSPIPMSLEGGLLNTRIGKVWGTGFKADTGLNRLAWAAGMGLKEIPVEVNPSQVKEFEMFKPGGAASSERPLEKTTFMKLQINRVINDYPRFYLKTSQQLLDLAMKNQAKGSMAGFKAGRLAITATNEEIVKFAEEHLPKGEREQVLGLMERVKAGTSKERENIVKAMNRILSGYEMRQTLGEFKDLVGSLNLNKLPPEVSSTIRNLVDSVTFTKKPSDLGDQISLLEAFMKQSTRKGEPLTQDTLNKLANLKRVAAATPLKALGPDQVKQITSFIAELVSDFNQEQEVLREFDVKRLDQGIVDSIIDISSDREELKSARLAGKSFRGLTVPRTMSLLFGRSLDTLTHWLGKPGSAVKTFLYDNLKEGQRKTEGIISDGFDHLRAVIDTIPFLKWSESANRRGAFERTLKFLSGKELGKKAEQIETEFPTFSATFAGDNISKVSLSRAERVSIYLHMQDESTRFILENINHEGFVWNGKLLKLKPRAIKAIVDSLTPEELRVAGELEKIMLFNSSMANTEYANTHGGMSLYSNLEASYWPRITAEKFEETLKRELAGDKWIVGERDHQRIFRERTASHERAFILEDAFSTSARYISQVANFVGTYKASHDAMYIIKNSEFRDTIIRRFHLGQDMLKRLETTVKEFRGSSRYEPDVTDVLWNRFYRNFSVFALGGKIHIGLMQGTAVAQMMPEVGAGWILKSLSSIKFGDDKLFTQEMKSWSPELYNRRMYGAISFYSPERFSAGLHDMLHPEGSWQTMSGIKTKIDQAALYFITFADRKNMNVLWRALKLRFEEEGLKGDELMKRVARDAERVTDRTQPTSDVLTAPFLSVEGKKNKIMRIFTLFRSPTMKMWDQGIRAVIDFQRSERTASDYGRLAYVVTAAVMVPSLLTWGIRYGTVRTINLWEDEKYKTTAMEHIMGVTQNALQGWPFVGDAIALAWEHVDSQLRGKPMTKTNIPMLSQYEALNLLATEIGTSYEKVMSEKELTKDQKVKFDKKLWGMFETASELGGVVAGLPTGAVFQYTRGVGPWGGFDKKYYFTMLRDSINQGDVERQRHAEQELKALGVRNTVIWESRKRYQKGLED